MATSLKIWKKGGRIDHLQFNTYHMVQRLWKSVQRILGYFSSERTSPVQNKIGCHGNVPWGIGKKLDQIKKIHANTFHLVKRSYKIGPVDTEIALFIVKKEKKKLRKVKYIARSAGLPSWLNKEWMNLNEWISLLWHVSCRCDEANCKLLNSFTSKLYVYYWV